MVKLIDSMVKRGHTPETYIKRRLKGLFILSLTLGIASAVLYTSHADSIGLSGHASGGVYYSRCFITLITLTLALLFLLCLGWWKWKHRMHHR